MEQTKALNALEASQTLSVDLSTASLTHTQPFLALTKSATSPRAATDLINRATSAPGTYIFTELLAAPTISTLASSPEPDVQAWHTHLAIFSHGLYSDYTSNSALPELNAAQQLKLRQLSLLNLSRDKAQLTYPSLMAHLALPSARELEDVVISAVYAGLLAARLNPSRQEVEVSSVAPLRDVQPASVAGLVNTLQQWSARCDATLAEIEASISTIRAEAARAAERKRESDRILAAAVASEEKGDGAGAGSGLGGTRHRQRRTHGAGQSAVANLKAQMSAGGGAKRGSEKLMESTAGVDDDDEAMDLDDDGDAPGQKRSSRRKL